jgi:hypothetical protein
VWGKNDKIFPADGAHPYKRDLPEVEFHLFDTSHFVLEDKADEVVPLIRDFLKRKIAQRRGEIRGPAGVLPLASESRGEDHSMKGGSGVTIPAGYRQWELIVELNLVIIQSIVHDPRNSFVITPPPR